VKELTGKSRNWYPNEVHKEIKVKEMELEVIRVLRSVVYMTKCRGPRTKPWGTPQEEVCKEERLLSYLTQKERDNM